MRRSGQTRRSLSASKTPSFSADKRVKGHNSQHKDYVPFSETPSDGEGGGKKGGGSSSAAKKGGASSSSNKSTPSSREVPVKVDHHSLYVLMDTCKSITSCEGGRGHGSVK